MKTQTSPDGRAGMVALNVWLTRIGVTPVTGWRWRNKGWLKTVNIMGRVYVTDEAVLEFSRRAQAGEFAKVHKTPARKDSTV
jgi:predicted site-specific integrase-resolvase